VLAGNLGVLLAAQLLGYDCDAAAVKELDLRDLSDPAPETTTI